VRTVVRLLMLAVRRNYCEKRSQENAVSKIVSLTQTRPSKTSITSLRPRTKPVRPRPQP